MTFAEFTKNKFAINFAKTGMFYLVAVLTITFLSKIGPSGPCTLGLGMLAFLFSIPVIGILFAVNLYKIIRGDKTYWISAGIHLAVLLCFFLTTCNKQSY